MARPNGQVVEAGSNAGSAPYATAAGAEAALFDNFAKQREAENLKTQFRMRSREQDLVSVTLAPTYRHPFGMVMPVRLNGMSIYIPCNGKAYKIPRAYAAIVHARRRAFDEQEMRQESMSQVQNNFEQFPGQRQFG